MSTTTVALKRLATDRFDARALQDLYLANRAEIDHTIAHWFGHSSVVQDATSRVLAKIATSAAGFRPRVHTPEEFIAQLVDEECRHVYQDAWENRTRH